MEAMSTLQPLIDTHLHLWDLDQFPYSWCAGFPVLNRSFRLDDYLAAAEGTGISKAVFVECDVDTPHALAEARQIQTLADNNPLIAGMVTAVRPEQADFPQQLEALLPLSKLRGVRRVLHVVPDAVSQNTVFVENVRRLAPHRLSFDLCVQARQLPLGLALVRKCPGVQFILDHCGVPDVKARAFEPWRSHLREMAALPNIACKISGLVAYADATSHKATDLRPWVEHALECFGWDRVIWGGDWPVCTLTASLSHWVGITRELLAPATETQRAQFFFQNAERIYRV